MAETVGNMAKARNTGVVEGNMVEAVSNIILTGIMVGARNFTEADSNMVKTVSNIVEALGNLV